jgi:hypothetical protein
MLRIKYWADQQANDNQQAAKKPPNQTNTLNKDDIVPIDAQDAPFCCEVSAIIAF